MDYLLHQNSDYLGEKPASYYLSKDSDDAKKELAYNLHILLGNKRKVDKMLKLFDYDIEDALRNPNELQQFMSSKDIAKLHALIEVSRLSELVANSKEIVPIKSVVDGYNWIYPFYKEHSYEEFWIVWVNRSMVPIRTKLLSRGGVSGTVVDIKAIIGYMPKTVHGIILSHNHPSGAVRPSNADLDITEKIGLAMEYHGINLVDHIIVTSQKGKYYSFAENSIIKGTYISKP